MHPKHLTIQDFTYTLPDDRIARYPASPRDAAKLLVCSDGQISETVFSRFPAQLPPNALLVCNRTRVIHARMLFRKPTGGVVELFCLNPDARYPDIQTAMQAAGSAHWLCLAGGAGRWRQDTPLALEHNGITVTAHWVGNAEQARIIRFDWQDAALTFGEVLQAVGHMPLPPYLHRDAEAGDETAYQTVFAKEEGSVAAPTAGLHFTPDVLAGLAARGVELAEVTLHVGAGTFKPVKGALTDHEMHEEWLEVIPAVIAQVAMALRTGRPVVAVGTTSMRTLESLYQMGCALLQGQIPDFDHIAVAQWQPYECPVQIAGADALTALGEHIADTGRERLVTKTCILIAPGYRFGVVQGLVTNFHQPGSTLLLLVDAFIGNVWRKVYDYALAHDFRFLSFGDGSLLWRNGDRHGASAPDGPIAL